MQNSLDRSLLHLFHRASQVSDELFAREVGHDVLTTRQYVILRAIREEEGLNQARLGHRTGIDRSTLADLVRRLEGKGLLSRRRRRKDVRSFEVRLTPAGSRALDAAIPKATVVDDRLLASLPPESRQLLLDMLVKISIHDWRAD